jgi:hypothetical protein
VAIIHATTMVPSKLDLLAAWLPGQPWYGACGPPRLTRAGGFRLDDPAGDVGIEFMAVRDDAGGADTAYLVPMTYRGAPLAGAENALIGTAEHGVLGPRWIYDGVRDPVLVAALTALVHGQAVPQHQSQSDVADPSVQVVGPRPAAAAVVPRGLDVRDEADRTVVTVTAPDAVLTFDVLRVLRPAQRLDEAGVTSVVLPWTSADGTSRTAAAVRVRG